MDMDRPRTAALVIMFYMLCQLSVSAIITKDAMKGTVLRALAYDYPPMFTMKKNVGGNYTYDGIGYVYMLWLSERFGLTIKFVNVDSDEMKKHDMAQIIEYRIKTNEIDLTSFPFDTSADNLRYLDISYPVWIDQLTLLQPWPKEQSRLVVSIRPFSPTVWLLFLASSAAFILIMTVLYLWENRDKQRRLSIPDFVYRQFQYIVVIITSNGHYFPYTSPTPLRIVVSAWILSMIVIVNAYTGVLTAILTVPKLEKTVDSLEELAYSNRLKLTVEDNSAMALVFLNASSGPNKILGDTLRKDPHHLLFTHLFDMMDNVLNHNCAYLGVKQLVDFFIGVDVKGNDGRCRMTPSLRPLDIYMFFRAGMPKGSPYTNIIDVQLNMRLWDFGMWNKLRDLYIPIKKQCQANTPPATRVRPIKLIDLTSAFLLFGLGTALSILEFVLEVVGPRVRAFVTDERHLSRCN